MLGPLRRWHVLPGLIAAILVVGPVQSHTAAAGLPRAEAESVGTSSTPTKAAYSGPLRTAAASPGAVRVAVFGELSGFDPRAIAATLNTDPRIDALPVGRARVAGGLSGFKVLVARFALDTPTRAMMTGLRQFVARGGGYVGEYWGAGAALTGLRAVPGLDLVFSPERFLTLFAGSAYGGGFITPDSPVQMTAPHPINAGLPGVLPSGDSTQFFVQALQPRDLRLETVARYTYQGVRYPALQAGEIGDARVALIWFDASDEPNRPFVRRLFVNSVYWAAS